MSSKDLYSIREWAPLTDVMEKIPARITRALSIFPADLNITCVDAISEYLALGSDVGIVFWYDRYTGETQKLRTEFAARITCLKIVDSVEYMVAAGNASGQVSVFQIQKQLPKDLKLVAPCTRAKPIERYTIRELHNSAVTSVEWSKNAMKLYSGDRQGVVVLTEFDFQTHLSKSVEILSETYEIVQISVCQSYLLLSTLYRSVVCQLNSLTGQWQVTQVGRKDRKILTDCGGIFLKQQSSRPILICGRPGLRFWIADAEGSVEKTLLFREAVARSPTWEIPILNPNTLSQRRISCSVDMGENDDSTRSFGKLHLYEGQDMLVVTHDECTLYVLNLDRLRVEAVARGFRKILDFCVYGKEIFILEGSRSLLRLAPLPEKPSKSAKIIFNPSMPPPVPLLGASIAGTFESPVESFEPSQQPLGKAEECFELPPIEALNLNVPIELAVESPRAEQNRRLEIFNQISELDFDQSILHHSGIAQSGGVRKKRTRHSRERDNSSAGSSSVQVTATTKSQGIVEIGRVVDPETEFETANNALTAFEVMETRPNRKHTTTTKPTFMNSSFCVSTTNMNVENETLSKSIKTLKNESKCGSVSTPLSPATPATTKKLTSIEHKSLAKELNLAGITDDPKQFKLDSTSPSPIHNFPAAPASTPTPTPLKELSQAYPRQTKVEDAGVQTTPRKRFYYNEEDGDEEHIYSDYSAGQPIDNLCHAALRTAILLEENNKPNDRANTSKASERTDSAMHLKFIPTQPVNEEINSFLPDFRRACDPCALPSTSHQTPPPLAESNGSSSEWEFLDN